MILSQNWLQLVAWAILSRMRNVRDWKNMRKRRHLRSEWQMRRIAGWALFQWVA